MTGRSKSRRRKAAGFGFERFNYLGAVRMGKRTAMRALGMPRLSSDNRTTNRIGIIT